MRIIQALSKEEFGLFQEFLVEESGLFFDEGRNQSLHLALWERLRKKGFSTYREYYDLLKFRPEGQSELRELLDLVTTGETYFFRNLPQFEALMKVVLPDIIQAKMYSADKSIRVWSAGCSSGDEAYSIAIAIMEALPAYESWNISILGTDINRNALMAAQEAIYWQKNIAHLPEEYLGKYFEKKGTSYFLIDSVKRLPRFEYHNLAKDPYTLEGMRDLDIVFCRNVTIYFDYETTKRVINNFYDCLQDSGVIFLGHAETLWGITDKFTAVEFPQTFVYKKKPYLAGEEAVKPLFYVPVMNLEDFAPAAAEPLLFEEGAAPQQKAVPCLEPSEAKNKKEELGFLYSLAARLVNQGDYEQALEFFDKIIARDQAHIPAYFAKATVLANQGKYQDAVKALEKIVEMDNLYVEAYYLMGVLLSKAGDLKGAEAQFRKVIYIDPDIVVIYFNLGNIYLFEKKFEKARFEFNNAVKILSRKDKNESVIFCGDFTADLLLRSCKKNLEYLTTLGHGGGDS